MNSFPLEKGDYEFLHLIGRGEFSEVFLARCMLNNKLVAAKCIDLECYPIDLEQLRVETSFWITSEHPNMIDYFGSFVNGSKLYLLTSYMDGGSCRDILNFAYSRGFRDEAIIATILQGVLQFLAYFHENHQIHRGIQTSNILLSTSGEIKVGDLGLAAGLIQQGQRQRARYTQIGSNCYSAPETMQEGTGHDEMADIWSLGITAIELATSKAPYSNLKSLEVVQAVISGPPPTLDENEFSPCFKDFVKCCLQKNPQKRSTAEALLKHTFIKKARTHDYLANTIMKGLPQLYERFELINDRITAESKVSNERELITFNFNLDDDPPKPATPPEPKDKPNQPPSEEPCLMPRAQSLEVTKEVAETKGNRFKFTVRKSARISESSSETPLNALAEAQTSQPQQTQQQSEEHRKVPIKITKVATAQENLLTTVHVVDEIAIISSKINGIEDTQKQIQESLNKLKQHVAEIAASKNK